ncbi:MAG: YIP1 family protein [Candidatus Korobacteraceae bacterium]
MSSTASAVSGAPLEQKPLSEIERVVDTFMAPSKTFTDLRRSANWLIPWLLLSIASVALVLVVDKKLGMEKVVENQMALQPKQAARLDQLSPEQRATQIQTIVKFNRVIAYAYPAVLVIVLAIIAAVLMASFNFGFGAELTFNQSLAVCMYASLPTILKALIAMLAIAVGGGESFTFQNPVASNLSGLVDPSSHFLYSIATSVDIITIWTLVLTGIGISCLTKIKRGTCLGVVFGWWAVVVLVGAGISAAFS